MKINFNKFIQIAGVIDKKEADLLVQCGVEYLGFPLRLPVNKEDLSEEEAEEIIIKLPGSVVPILITYQNTHEDIIRFTRQLNVNCIQLHGDLPVNELKLLKEKSPESCIIKSVIVRDNNTDRLKEKIKNLDNYVDAFITDTFDPQTGATGATGKTHDWNISAEIVKYTAKPVILAGGLNPNNVIEAILKVKPAGVDAHTGVEDSFGSKNKNLVREFLQNAKRAFQIIELEKKNVTS
jgi:phosphoribosylanthranilate isomerase